MSFVRCQGKTRRNRKSKDAIFSDPYHSYAVVLKSLTLLSKLPTLNIKYQEKLKMLIFDAVMKDTKRIILL